MKVWSFYQHCFERFLGLKKAWAFVCLVLALGCTPKLRIGPKPDANGTNTGQPNLGVMLLDPISSPGTIDTPTIRVSGVTSGDTVAIYTDSACLVGNLKASGVAASASIDLGSSSLALGSYTFYAKSTDAVGNESSCSVASVTYQRVSPASLSISPHTSPYDFGEVAVGGTKSVVLTVTNSGGYVASNISFSLDTFSSPEFTRDTNISSNCGSSLAAGANCNLKIDFAPTSVTTFSTSFCTSPHL